MHRRPSLKFYSCRIRKRRDSYGNLRIHAIVDQRQMSSHTVLVIDLTEGESSAFPDAYCHEGKSLDVSVPSYVCRRG